MSFQDFELIPADDPQVTPDEDLSSSVTGALALNDGVRPASEDPPLPLGQSWDFDWETGQFRRHGSSPVPVTALDALAQWCYAAINSTRYAHPIFSDEFGLEEPDNVIGSFPVSEGIADWQRAVIDALMVHDRITSVQNISLSWDPTTGILTVETLDVITDDEDALTLTGVTLQAGGP